MSRSGRARSYENGNVCRRPLGLGAARNRRPIDVLLVDADPKFAQAVTRDFDRNNFTVTVAGTLAEARTLLGQAVAPVDVVVLAIRLPDGSGQSLLADIDACPRQPAVLLTSTLPSNLEPECLQYRPVSIVKPLSTILLQRMVRAVAMGYARSSIQRFLTRFKLTKHEKEVVALLAHGLKPKEIANHLHSSDKAVYAALARTCAKTGCIDYHQLVGNLFAFTCQTLGHTPPEYRAFIDQVSQP